MTRKILPAAATLAVLALAAAGCGGSSSSGSGGGTVTEAAGGGLSAATTVSVRSAQGAGDVLVDAKGATLYTPKQEAGGMIRCTGSCTSIWPPLTLPAGMVKPSGGSAVMGKLGTVRRPDGSEQVTLDGKPLYRFVQDGGPGSVTGDGVSDSFGGKSFSWHAVTPTGVHTGGSGGSGSTVGGYGY